MCIGDIVVYIKQKAVPCPLPFKNPLCVCSINKIFGDAYDVWWNSTQIHVCIMCMRALKNTRIENNTNNKKKKLQPCNFYSCCLVFMVNLLLLYIFNSSTVRDLLSILFFYNNKLCWLIALFFFFVNTTQNKYKI